MLKILLEYSGSFAHCRINELNSLNLGFYFGEIEFDRYIASYVLKRFESYLKHVQVDEEFYLNGMVKQKKLLASYKELNQHFVHLKSFIVLLRSCAEWIDVVDKHSNSLEKTIFNFDVWKSLEHRLSSTM